MERSRGRRPLRRPVHDYGETWTQQKLSDSKRYYYAYDGRVLADGTVVFAESSLQYSGSKTVQGEVWHHPVISRDGGATWEDRVVAKVPVGENCVATATSRTSTSARHRWSPTHPASSFRVRGADHRPRATAGVRRHPSDAGRRWSTATPLSTAGEDATGPRLAAQVGPCGSGTCRLPAPTTRTRGTSGTGARSTAGGPGRRRSRSPTRPQEPTDYVGPNGFAEVYGDYGEIGVTSAGKTFATWGEGFSYTGPGGTWFNVQR